jgi:hypothetical protein
MLYVRAVISWVDEVLLAQATRLFDGLASEVALEKIRVVEAGIRARCIFGLQSNRTSQLSLVSPHKI